MYHSSYISPPIEEILQNQATFVTTEVSFIMFGQ